MADERWSPRPGGGLDHESSAAALERIRPILARYDVTPVIDEVDTLVAVTDLDLRPASFSWIPWDTPEGDWRFAPETVRHHLLPPGSGHPRQLPAGTSLRLWGNYHDLTRWFGPSYLLRPADPGAPDEYFVASDDGFADGIALSLLVRPEHRLATDRAAADQMVEELAEAVAEVRADFERRSSPWRFGRRAGAG